ncbi:MAG: phospholipid scramblase-related protein [Elusimicrobiota bacterium]|nr:phospholipid scramblase-related protein [Elusimicrobiota bacterium]
MEKLKAAESVVVQQKKEWGEILTGFETKNRYAVLDASGQQLYWAAEESSVIARLLLKVLRPFRMHILSVEGLPVMKTVRPFRFYFHEMDVFNSDGKLLGNIRREFSILTKKFTVADPQGAVLYSILAPVLHPWTFKISEGGAETGEIVKRWSGLAKEAFTDSDNFSVMFPRGASADQKAVLLGALFLIDIVYFEK